MNEINGGICAPRGYKASGVAAQLKKSGKKDCALVVSTVPATVAGTFTTNLVKAAPVQWTEGVCIRGAAQAVFINSGNANACTGQQGIEDAQATAELLCHGLNVPITEVCVLSTGVIGVPLPMDKIKNGVTLSIEALSENGGEDAATAIMTTDTVKKEFAVEVPLSQGSVRIGATCKGSGMINPNMATMISVITTDAKIEHAPMQEMLLRVVNQSYNRLCIDNDMSTNDAVVMMANGQAELDTLLPGTDDFVAFEKALVAVCQHTAKLLVKDGEGATKFITINVQGAKSDEDALKIARSVATSQLCKTAFFGEDANWGRIGAAAGYSGADFDPRHLSICLDNLEVVHEGLPTRYQEADAAAIMKQTDITVKISVGDGLGKCTFWTCDMSYDYVKINADYRS